MNLIFFSVKIILISGMLFSYYWLLLRNKKFHQYNRFYLLSIPVTSICLPSLNIPVPGFDTHNQSTAIKILNVVAVRDWENVVIITPKNNFWHQLMNWQNISLIMFISIAVVLLFVFAKKLWYVKRISNRYPYTQIEEIKFFNTEEPGTPFSFLKNIFWNNQIDSNTEKGKQIFRHELFHVRQKHTTDILFMEITGIIFWFNPFFYFIKKELKTVHEFLADQYAASETNSHDYAELLALSAATNYHFHLANSFFNNQLKRRITMLTQFKNPHYGYISRLMALPLLFILVCAFAVKTIKPKNTQHIISVKSITAIIDAGHGGMYNGTTKNGVEEKNINLSIAKKIQQLGKEYNVNVVLTRDNDAAVGNANTLKEDLENRVNIATENKADIFISIHVNADAKPVSEKSGFEIVIPKNDDNANISKCILLASALAGEL
ncbi:MAG: N-acetylmuramoyl-L-alanine amidase, partial [Bacteroidetes bacterium]|nr:N-acetylmuramoyl-L-alanine amidase [Bacteroidota bacterium]